MACLFRSRSPSPCRSRRRRPSTRSFAAGLAALSTAVAVLSGCETRCVVDPVFRGDIWIDNGTLKVSRPTGGGGHNEFGDVAHSPIEGCTEIAGSIRMNGNGADPEALSVNLPFRNIEVIHGSMYTTGGLGGSADGYPFGGYNRLREVGGLLDVCCDRDGISGFHSLERVGALVLASTKTGTSFSNLREVRSDALVSHVSELHALETVGGDLTLKGDNMTVNLPSLRTVGGDLILDDVLDDRFGFDSLESIGGDLDIDFSGFRSVPERTQPIRVGGDVYLSSVNGFDNQGWAEYIERSMIVGGDVYVCFSIPPGGTYDEECISPN